MFNKLLELKTSGGGDNLSDVLEIFSDGKVYWKEADKELNADLNEGQIKALTELAESAHEAKLANRNLVPEVMSCEIPAFEVVFNGKKLFETCGEVPQQYEQLMSALEEVAESCREYAS